MVKSALIALGLLASPVAAEPCRLALLLALDVSSSVDAQEHLLQRRGMAAALDDPDIRRAILQGGRGHVAIAAYEWSGRRQHQMLVDWRVLDSDGAITQVIGDLLAAPRSENEFPTAMGYAVGYGAGVLARGPDCTRKVLDVAGDGVNNDGFGPEIAYRHFPFTGVTVNGLAVLGADDEVQSYFLNTVRLGPNAFVETSIGYDGFRTAMTRKLFREINDLVVADVAK